MKPLFDYEDENKSKISEKEAALMKRFDRFWTAYPKKVSKGQAKKAWKRINPDDELLDKMLAALADQVKLREWQFKNRVFIPAWPYPSTWLNAEKWDDITEIPADDVIQTKAIKTVEEIRKEHDIPF